MANHGEGSADFENSDLTRVFDQSSEFQFGWNEDNVDLEFKTDDLNALLEEKEADLDYQLFRQTDQLDSMLREELNSINTSLATSLNSESSLVATENYGPHKSIEDSSILSSFFSKASSPSSSTFDSDLLPTSLQPSRNELLYKQIKSDTEDYANSLDSVAGFTHKIDENKTLLLTSTEAIYFQDSEKHLGHDRNEFPVFISILLGILALTFFLIIILLVYKYKNTLKNLMQGPDIPLHSSGFKSRLNKDDNSRFIVNIRNAQHAQNARSPKSTVVEMPGANSSIQPHVSIIGTSIPRPQHQSCSTLIEEQFSRKASNASPASSFIPSNPSLDRTSPEGRSCGGLDPDVVVHVDDDSTPDQNCTEQGACTEYNERALEDITSISSYFNFQTPTSHLSQSKASQPEDKMMDLLGEVGLKYIDCSATEEDGGEKGEETSISSFSTFYTPTSNENISWKEDKKIQEEIDFADTITKRLNYMENKDKEKEQHEWKEQSSLCSFHTSTSDQEKKSSSSNEQCIYVDKKEKIVDEQLADVSSLASFYSFQTPMSNLSIDKTVSVEDVDLINLTNIDNTCDPNIPTNKINSKEPEKGSVLSLYAFYTPFSGLSLESDRVDALENDDLVSKSSESSLKLGKERTSSVSSYSNFCHESDSWMDNDVFSDGNPAEDSDIISSFSTFNKLMDQLNKENKIPLAESKSDLDESCQENAKSSTSINLKDIVDTMDDTVAKMDASKEENIDEKTSSEENSSSLNSSSIADQLYTRLDSDELDNTAVVFNIEPTSKEEADSPLFYSTTPLLASGKSSPTLDDSLHKEQKEMVENLIEISNTESGESEDEIDLTAFKERIMQNAKEENFDKELYQKIDTKKKKAAEDFQTKENDSEFLI